jgi:signal transduction histidine kinase
MESTLQKLEQLIAEIDRVALEDEGALARVHAALDAVGARLRAVAAGREARDARPATPPLDRADWMGEEARRIGHDLNNCLGVVGGRAELMAIYLQRGKTEDVGRGIEVILGQIERMRELSDRLRSLRHGPAPLP